MTTERPKNVRAAVPADEDAIMGLMRLAFKEQPILPLNEQKIREKIRMCTERKKDVLGGVVGVIDGPEGLEGYVIAIPSRYWYTDAWHLEELSNFVHPDHRHPGHAKALIEFMKWFTEQLGLPLQMGILSTIRLEAKTRLYSRQMKHCGAVFVHNTGHEMGLLSEMG